MIQRIGLFFLLIAFVMNMNAQSIFQDSITAKINIQDDQYHFKWKQTVLPVALIGVGASALAPKFITHEWSHKVTSSIIDMRGDKKRPVIDDYIQYIPVSGAWLLGCMNIKAKHKFWERTLIVATSYATLGVLVNTAKLCIDEKRPEFNSKNSFPSGHTATAFMGAELVRIEYGKWYGLGAYSIATCVGFMRMYKGKHYLNDIIAGAGVGILSARVGEWSGVLWHKLIEKKRGRKDFAIALTPVASPVENKFYGFNFNCVF